jgi:DNA-binding SARP family transcriptional activator
VLEFRILGPLEVVGDQGPIPIRAPKQRATLAILLLNANRVVSVDRLADNLYAGAAPVTAVSQVQRQISDLRKALASPAVIETRAPGYVLHLAAGQLDLARFEQEAEEAGSALARGEHEGAARLLRAALGLWRGPPLADLTYESFAKTAIDRLEEVRLAALEQCVDAELPLGRHAELVPELEELVAEYPLRERLRAHLMVALYRSGRQADALDVYRRGRDVLVGEFGIDPSSELRELERAILAQDDSLDLRSASPPLAPSEAPRAVLVVPSNDGAVGRLLAVARPLAELSRRELILARLVDHESELAAATSLLNTHRESFARRARTAAFTTTDRAADVVRLAAAHDVQLVLLDAAPDVDGERLPAGLEAILESSPADVALLAEAGPADGGVFVPFGGGDHDWAALELGAWLASRADPPVLTLVGTRADPAAGARDASRLLGDASLAVQRVTGVLTEPLLADPTDESLVAAVEPAGLVVVGISPRWRTEGIGSARRALVRRGRGSVLVVHQGLRPSGLAPRAARTRFSWSIQPEPA